MTIRRTTKVGGLVSLFSVSAVLLLLAGGYLWLLGGTSPHASGSIGGPWTLTRADGKVVSDRDFRGRFLLIYFGYTSCPDICPTTLGVVEDVMQQLGSKASRLQPVFITVDPQRDTPAVVERYLSSFGPNLIGLTGTTAQILAVQRIYRIRSVVHSISSTENDNIDHTAVLLLIGPDGRYLLPLTLDATPAEIIARLSPYLSS